MKTQFGEVNIIRSRRKSISVRPMTGGIEVRAPLRMSDRAVLMFLDSNRIKILAMLKRASEKREKAGEKLSDEQIAALAAEAKKIIPQKCAYFAALMGVKYGRVSIRCQKTRWGSCSSAGNLNFNCLLMLCPDEVINYVVVHELAHRKQMNHSPKFWAEVEKIIPQYLQYRKWLRSEGTLIMERTK